MFKKKKTPTQVQQRNLITINNPMSPITEQYKTIRTNIQYTLLDDSLKSIVVTSPNPGEGKSTTAANLAVVFAQQGKKTLLVDADMRKPTVHYTFQSQNTLGLTNVLTKKEKLSNVTYKTDQENLYVLSCGPIPPNPAELLGSTNMKDFLEQSYKEFDMMIFDTPPVLAVTDAQILSNICQGTILVTNSGKTQIASARKAKELLIAANAKILGVILNRRDMKEENYYYYGNQ